MVSTAAVQVSDSTAFRFARRRDRDPARRRPGNTTWSRSESCRADALESFAENVFRFARSVLICGVKEGDAVVERRVNAANRLLARDAASHREPGAETQFRNLKRAVAQAGSDFVYLAECERNNGSCDFIRSAGPFLYPPTLPRDQPSHGPRSRSCLQAQG